MRMRGEKIPFKLPISNCPAGKSGSDAVVPVKKGEESSENFCGYVDTNPVFCPVIQQLVIFSVYIECHTAKQLTCKGRGDQCNGSLVTNNSLFFKVKT